jgi:hypothetical protein
MARSDGLIVSVNVLSTALERDDVADRDRVRCANKIGGGSESVTRAVNVYVPAIVGVPLSNPSDRRLIPFGREPAV